MCRKTKGFSNKRPKTLCRGCLIILCGFVTMTDFHLNMIPETIFCSISPSDADVVIKVLLGNSCPIQSDF